MADTSAWSAKNWLVTGSSTGFGRAIAEAVLARGGRVAATARDPAALADLARAHDGRVLPLRLDVSDPAQVTDAIAQVEAWGGIDVLVNNAGYGFLGGVEESTEAEITAQMDVNFFGVVRMIRAALPSMRARGRGGYIVNISSIAGVRSFGGSGFYSASKFALEGLSEALHSELEPFGIRTLIVEPGYFRTDFAGRSIAMTAGHPDYPHLAKQRAAVPQGHGRQPGDPVRGAQAIITAMESATPPLRLALGADAYQVCTEVMTGRLGELNMWRDLSESTQFPEG